MPSRKARRFSRPTRAQYARSRGQRSHVTIASCTIARVDLLIGSLRRVIGPSFRAIGVLGVAACVNQSPNAQMLSDQIQVQNCMPRMYAATRLSCDYD